eukprot:GFKZ01005765.1.p1 GENE.GFKZ01005765.1~~GFKZ01005765.1.p1  ORF type:complete len:989 (+),score=151.19 GFKZ01005765.1:159-3125(+)
MTADGIIVHPPLEVSPLDQRTYRAATLSNDLSVLLISDHGSDKAAAAMNVAVGHFSDPPEIPGLAHFCEHMLFLGTEKYPDEGSYNRYLSENGGSSNAYTSSENTNFHFDMVAQKDSLADTEVPRFKEALDRFAQFFTAPLFTESATERELNAVHSEHQKNLQNDSRRMYELRKVVCNKSHPFHKFGTGSRETLWDMPKAHSLDTRAALLDFHRKFYSANIMSLCVIGPYDLDILLQWVAELFSSIPNYNTPLPYEQYSDIQPLLPDHLGLMYHFETITDIRLLKIHWLTPSYARDSKTKPPYVVANLLGDEGDGSILSLLKIKGWADSLTTSSIPQMTFGDFLVSITLTKEGVDHINDVVAVVYDYIRMLRKEGIKEWLFKEEAKVGETAFRFRERESPYGLVVSLAGHMLVSEPEEYLSGLYLYKKYDEKKIMELVNCLTPENGNIFIGGRFVAGKTNKRERWYGTPYRVEPIDPKLCRLWRDGAGNSELCLPEPNPFIPTDFDLRAERLPDSVDDDEGPEVILNDDYMCVHHKLDRTFGRPKAIVIVQMCTPFAYLSPWHAVMANILSMLLEDSLKEYSYAAEKAGFRYSLMQVTTGMRLYLEGYSHRIDVLLDAVIKKMTTFEADQTRFDMIRDCVERDYANFAMAQPYQNAMYTINYLLEEPRWHVNEYVKVLNSGSVTLEAFNRYAKEFRERLFIKALFAGNITADDAVAMMKSVRSSLDYEPLPDSEQICRRVVKAPLGKDTVLRSVHTNPDDNNSAVDVFFEVGPRGDFDADVKIELLSEIMNKPTFHELRTVQQLGYIVSEGVGACDYVLGIYFIIQSTEVDPDDVVRRIDKFLVDFRKTTLGDMSSDKFQDYVRSLTANKAEPDENLAGQSWRFWDEISSRYRQYNRSKKELEALKLITKEDILNFFDVYIAEGGSCRRRVISQVYGTQHPIDASQQLSDKSVEIHDAIAFRRQQELYPVGGIRSALKASSATTCPKR